MLSKLFRRRGPRAEAAAPPNTRIYAIGDIHGRADLLADLHRVIRDDAAAHPERDKAVVYVGDYVDRGLQSREVVELLLGEPLQGFEAIHLKGNHEAMMLDFLDDPAVGAGWLEIGGAATLYSYGVSLDSGKPMPERLLEAQDRLRGKLPAGHVDFLRGLRLQHVAGDYLFVHAGVRPGVALERQSEDDLLWIRQDFLESSDDHGKVVVHGHSITWKPEILPNRIGIDTGAFASGTLTCAVLDGTERAFLHARR